MSNSRVIKIKLFVPAGGATTTPPFGPILGQYGVNTVQFCKDFNEFTEGLSLFFDESIEDYFGGFLLSVDITINEDKTYNYVLNKPSTSFLLRLLTGVKVGSPQRVVGTLSIKELVLLSQFKFPSYKLLSACKMVAGTARSIGIRVIV